MFFLVTDASGVGKSTVRQRIAPAFAGVPEAIEFAQLGSTPQWTLEWRHRMVERCVRRALEVQAQGRHFLLCGDPVPPGEVWAAPSADRLDTLHVCVLDARPEVQTGRLKRRGDTLEYLHHHLAFAEWMRHHAVDPQHRPEVITGNGWADMRWERWVGRSAADLPWTSEVFDTSDLEPEDVTTRVAGWLRARLTETEVGLSQGQRGDR